MNCAGYAAANDSASRHGAPCWPNGIAPASNQASITSGTREATSPHDGHGNVTASTYGRCGSSDDRSRPASVPRAASDGTHVMCPAAHSHTGRGAPQYRVRDSAQSTLPRSHEPYRPSLIPGGCQRVTAFSASSASLTAVVRMNHEGTA